MSTIRGRGRSLEIAIDRPLPDARVDLRAQLDARPGFFRGSRAVAELSHADLGTSDAAAGELAALRDLLAEFGITLEAVRGPAALAPLLGPLDLDYRGATPAGDPTAPNPRPRSAREGAVGDSTRSLIADFAGARADLAARRTQREAAGYERRGPASGPATAGVEIPAVPHSAPAGISTLYHRGTLRGGQTLHNLGNIVVIGDVNPGAELIASGDVVVFGALRGVAHAGAQGDASARVVALELAPTQLRIATMITTPDGPNRRGRAAACVYFRRSHRDCRACSGRPRPPGRSSFERATDRSYLRQRRCRQDDDDREPWRRAGPNTIGASCWSMRISAYGISIWYWGSKSVSSSIWSKLSKGAVSCAKR